MSDEKRKFSEIVALYSLEETLKDIFVEGDQDKRIYSTYLRAKQIAGDIVGIDSVDITSIEDAHKVSLDMSSNKDKLIALSRSFEHAKATETQVRCLVDRDFDDYIPAENNKFLWRTDFTCLEAYFFCSEFKKKIIDIGLGSFPINITDILKELGSVLRFLFAVRLWRKTKNHNFRLLKLDNNLNVDKGTGAINFSQAEYLDKLFNSVAELAKNRGESIKEIDAILGTLNIDARYALNKHDYLKAFFLYVNKIKNTPNYREDQFANLMYSSIESTSLAKYKLFQDFEMFFA